MKITHDAAHRKFLAHGDDGVYMGYIEYSYHDCCLSAIHTRTEEQFRGHGVAKALLDALADYALSKNQKVIPVCPYAVAAFKKDPERYRAVIREPRSAAGGQ